jgi:diguanylate cyclase (GGDEF)-like protein
VDGRAASPGRRFSFAAGAYFWLVVAAAGAVLAVSGAHILAGETGLLDPRDWATFVVLGFGLAAAQMFVVVTPANQSYHTTAVFLIPAVLLLPPELVALLPVVQHVPDWIRRRLPFQIQTFNIANYTLAAMAAWATAHQVAGAPGTLGGAGAAAAAAGACAAVVFVSVNHVLLAPMLKLARGHSLRETGLFTVASLSTDLAVAALGVGFASLWATSPWLAPFALAPLVLIHRSLAVPALEAEARIDPKTGLFNARHFAAALEDELERARRFGRPVSVLLADLDLLRDINNTYGHLAGDGVLTGIADVLRQELRDYDVPARFGGEEFAVVLPETDAREAVRLAERIRRAVAASEFEVRTSDRTIGATLSIGVAAFPRDGSAADEVVHRADLAAYRAKLRGRNRVVDAAESGLEDPVDARPGTLRAAS